MPVLLATIHPQGFAPDPFPWLSQDLQLGAPVDYPRPPWIGPVGARGIRLRTSPTQTRPRLLANARVMHSHFLDYYFRVYLQPQRLDVGNLVSDQVRQVAVWNAFPDRSVTLEQLDLVGGEGVEVSGAESPVLFRPLQDRSWELTIGTSGPPILDASLNFVFTGLYEIPVAIVGRRLQAWPLPADWGGQVAEHLDWLTDVQQAVDGSEDREPLREAPRRAWEFDLVEGRRERRIIENMVYDWKARVWAMPVMTDISLLADALQIDSGEVPVATAGLDFVAGGLAMLWRDVASFELVEIDQVLADRLVLARPTLSAWPRGTRLYPCRTARLTDAPVWRRKSDQVITSRVRFQAAEPCDWPAVAPPTTYLGRPVLDWRTDEGEDPTASSPRQEVVIDGDIGLVAVDDETGLAWPTQSHARVLHGRAQRAQHRSFLYWCQGRYREFWVPTWADDIELSGPVNGGSSTLFVVRSGIAEHLRQQPGRRHLRIELKSGTVIYRQVMTSAAVDAEREQLLLNSPVGVAIQPQQVRQICWMALKRQASDHAEIAHLADTAGVARVRTSFIGVGRAEP